MAGTKKNIGKNKWKLYVSAGYSSIDGKQRRFCKTVIASSERAADKLLNEFYIEKTKNPQNRNRKMIFGEFVLIWKVRYGDNLSPTTIHGNKSVLNRLLSAFEHMALDKISPEDVLEFVADLNLDGRRGDRSYGRLSPTTVYNSFKLMRSIYNKAVEWGYVNSNPCEKIPRNERPKPSYKSTEIYQEPELGKFLQQMERLKDTPNNVKYKLMVHLALLNMLRRGEIFGITWNDCDFENRIIDVQNSCYKVPNLPIGLKKPKTKKSERVLFFSNTVKKLLILHKQFQIQYLQEHGFTNPNGYVFIRTRGIKCGQEVKLASPSSIYNWLQRFLRKNNLAHITVHAFRHMGATYSLANGVDIVTVQAAMGHNDLKTTSIYTHEINAKKKFASEQLNDVINGIKSCVNIKDENEINN